MKDPEIRQLLRRTTLRTYLSDPNSRVVEELRLSPAKAQVDIAIINGAFHAYEIKSASDTLRRLPDQIDSYRKIFDFVTVVTEGKYEREILRLAPSWVGISICSKDYLHLIRKPQRNQYIEGFYIAQLLWRDEIKSLLLENKISYRSSLRNWLLCELLAETIAAKQLSKMVREKLRKRLSWK